MCLVACLALLRLDGIPYNYVHETIHAAQSDVQILLLTLEERALGGSMFQLLGSLDMNDICKQPLTRSNQI